MNEDSIQKQLRFFFPGSTRDDWRKVAVQETNGKDPFELLSWHGKDDINFLPYYDAQHAEQLRKPEQHVPAGYRWLNIPAISVSSEVEANKIVHQLQRQGADGVFFYLNQLASPDIHQLISGSEPETRFYFRINDDQYFQKVFTNPQTTHTLQRMNGGLFWESIPKTSSLSDCFKRWQDFHALGIIASAPSPAEEIGMALYNGVQVYETFGAGQHVLRSISFSVSADISFLETVAKIRALRQLWWQVARAYGHDDYNTSDLHIHARSLLAPDNHYAPRENMLKATFASMAAVIGGCNSLTAEGDDTVLFQRWATNLANILREESFFDRMMDPLAGAYAVEVMTDSIAKKAWELFQSKMKAS